MTPASEPSAEDRQARFRAVAGHFATGVVIVTGSGPRGPCGLTANAVCSLSLAPPLLLVCFDNGARTLPVVRDSGRFAVNVLSSDQRDLSLVFASKRSEREKFAGVGHRLEDGLPIIDGALAWIVCELERLVEAGDHTIAIGAVGELEGDGGGDPLIFYRSEYRALRPSAPHLGPAPE